MSGPVEGRDVDHRHVISEYFRLERWEIPPPPGSDLFPEIGGRAPLDAHQLGAGGGLRTGSLLTSVDSLGGFLCGISVQPEWIVTTSMMATVAQLSHRGPLRLHGRILRRGRNAVVAALDVVDEGLGDRAVAAVTMTSSVLDPGDMRLPIKRPFMIPMGPPDPDAPAPEEFFCIEPGTGPVTRLDLADRLRNPWGILHGGAVAMLADVAACRAVAGEGGGDGRPVAAADTVLHYLRPVKVGPVEARCQVLGGGRGRTRVRVAVHDIGADARLTSVGTVTVLDVPATPPDPGDPPPPSLREAGPA
jgi:uncharacterized protein (TIGR00369 family)